MTEEPQTATAAKKGPPKTNNGVSLVIYLVAGSITLICGWIVLLR